jgi:hypothetical protein
VQRRLALKLEQEKIQHAESKSCMQLCSSLLPGVATLLGEKHREVGRLQNPNPVDVGAIVLAAFNPKLLSHSIGIKAKRVITAVAKLILARQARGIALCKQRARLAKMQETASENSKIVINLAYSHEWDESRAIFAAAKSKTSPGVRQSRAGTPLQTMVQRGECEFHMIEERADREIRHASFSEQVLVPPQIVQGTSAAHLLPALQKGIPTDLHMWSEEAMHELMECVDCFVFLPLGDRASSNVSIMKMWGHTWSHHFKDTYQGRVMYLAETCQVHSHHRAKIALADLGKHIARHYSLAHLYRLPSVLMQAANSLVAYFQNNFQRQACPPTAEAIEANKLWRTFFDVLYDLSSTAHDRASGKRAQRIEDTEDFLSRAFARPGSSSFLHHCWDAATKKSHVAPAGKWPCRHR